MATVRNSFKSSSDPGIFRCTDVDVIYDVHRNLSAPQNKFPTEMDSRSKAGRKVGKMNMGNSSLGEESRDTRATAVEQCYAAGMSFMVAEIALSLSESYNTVLVLNVHLQLLTKSAHCKTNKQTNTNTMGFLKAKLMLVTYHVKSSSLYCNSIMWNKLALFIL